MEVILDDGPFLDERLDRPRSHTWPLPDPAGLLVVDTKNVADQSPEPCQPHITVSNENNEGVKKYVEGTSPRKNNRKNAWGNLSYADLITQAIDSSPEKRLTLAQIYEWMVKNIVYFKDKGDSTSSAGWKVCTLICSTNLFELVGVLTCLNRTLSSIPVRLLRSL